MDGIKSHDRRFSLGRSILTAAIVYAIVTTGASTIQGQIFSPVADWAEDAALHDVHFVDNERGWAVGARGTILSTIDGGHRWEVVRSPVSCELDTVFFLDDRIGWIAGGFARPMTSTTTGVVLRTEDGGRSWRRVSDDRIPWLKRIRMDDPRHGWALVHRSSLFPVGLAVTRDGGQSWQPVSGRANSVWTDAARLGVSEYVLVGRQRQAARVDGQELKPGFVLTSQAGNVAALSMADPIHGWACDDRGHLLFTSDGGFSWDITQRHPDLTQTRNYSWCTLATWGDHVWVAGSPGNAIWHSADAGQTWQAALTNTSLPIQRLFFRDQAHGWAVGANGLVLATEDAGASWQLRRQTSPRVAVLGLFTDVSRIPFEFFARYSGNDGYTSAIVLVRSSDQPLRPNSPTADRLRLSAAGVGVAGVEEIVIGKAEDMSSEVMGRLVRAIRTWRPSVIVTDVSSTNPVDDSGGLCTQQQLVNAVHAAAASQQSGAQPEDGLPVWQVPKVFASVGPANQSDWSLDADQFATRLGTSLDDYCIVHRKMMTIPNQERTTTPKATYWSLIETSLVGQSQRSLFAGIDQTELDNLRRKIMPPGPGNLGVMQRQSRKRGLIERIAVTVDSTSDDEGIWSRQVEGLLIGLGELGAGNALFQLAEEHQRRRQFEPAARAYHWLVLGYRSHPFWDRSMMWLIQYYASAEAQWMADDRSLQLHIPLHEQSVRPAAADAFEPIMAEHIPTLIDDPIYSNYESPATTDEASVDNIPAAERWAHAQLLMQALDRRRPAALSDNALQFAMSAIDRSRQGSQLAPPQVIATAKLSHDRWHLIALCESWLRDDKEAPPIPVVLCYSAAQPPQLDGRLDDDLWEATSAIPLHLFSEASTNNAPSGEIRIAHDREFLFVAIRCGWESEQAHQSASAASLEPTPRIRDEDLSDQDRVILELDVDRDWTTSFRLEVDQRGCLRDLALGDESWNPQWFVAHRIDETDWTVEIAIPFSQLGQRQPIVKDAWAVRIERVSSAASSPLSDAGTFDIHRSNALLMFAQ